MPLRTFKRIVNMIPTRTEVRIFLSGEPFLHPDIIDMIKFTSLRGHAVLVHSNGTITKKQADGLMDVALEHPYNIYLNFTSHGDSVSEAVDYLINNQMGLTITLQKILPYPQPLEIPEYMEKYKGKVRFNIRHPHNWDKKDSIKDSEPADYKGVCGFLEDSVAIYWNGDVTTCCADLNGDRVIGHVDDGWGVIEATMNSLVKNWGAKDHPCRGCERY